MSNGNLGTPKNPWGEMKFSPYTLWGLVASEMGAVENAQGDVKGATERLVEAVQAAEKVVNAAAERLADQQKGVAGRLAELGLTGRAIDFTRGTSLGIRENPDEDGGNPVESTENDLVGVSGSITGFEVGAVFGEPIGEPNLIVLHADVEGSKDSTLRRYAFNASGGEYIIGKVPRPETPQDPR
jgi:hypothetical protein